MARATKLITINTETGRDKGKVFLVTEPNAFIGERMFNQAFSLCGEDVTPQSLMMKTATAEGRELWESLLYLVKYVPNPNDISTAREIDQRGDDIEDISTVIRLRGEALSMIVNFTEE
ncbi:hypothetical protein DES39_1882 [Orbus hercynius]|uniref:Uncharacterized protein n=1 Tax=Orbus hercynius TaxID=593135 RepID=A0A495RBP1_9GAMM|nr:hypothetical protein [Orbus hercynius]RKS84670.1 hypothetical protein DES39_1882 [Orbus hercynius]